MSDETLEQLATAYRFRRPQVPFRDWLEQQFHVERQTCRTDVRARARLASKRMGERPTVKVTPLTRPVVVAEPTDTRPAWRRALEDLRAMVRREVVA